MLLPLLASGIQTAVGREVLARPLVGSKARLLAAGASVLAFGIVNPATAEAANVPGVVQHTEDNIAINLFDLAPEDIAQSGAMELASTPDGHALAEAIVACAGTATCPEAGAFVQYARGTQTADNTAMLGGALTIGAHATAEGASATAAGLIQIGLSQVAAAEGFASNDLIVTGALDIGASADALAGSGQAVAFAGMDAGVSQIASSIGTAGAVSNFIFNSGELTVVADAGADALAGDAAATAVVGAGLYQESEGDAAAGADLMNFGNILVQAGALADAQNGIAVASASAAGIVQIANARAAQFGSSTTSGGALVGTSSDTPSGPASLALDNNGVIHVDVDAAAVAGVDADVTAAAIGVQQLVSGSQALAQISNNGSINIDASANAEASGTPRGTVFVSGLAQTATAYAYSTVETIDPAGVLTYELSSTPVGPAVATLANAATIAVAGDVNVVALGTGSMDEGLGAAFVNGLDQYAAGTSARAEVDNKWLINVAANVTVDSGNISNAVAIASGIDQTATAYASQATVVFANGTTTPTSFTGSSTAIGPTVASLENSGAIRVYATVDSHGDEIAFAGATAAAIGQFAAGTDALVKLDNQGLIASIGSVSSSGRTAYGGAAAIGIEQAAQATADADAVLFNDDRIVVRASAEGEGEAGAFMNATAFGISQNVLSDGAATAVIENSGSILISALADAAAGDSAATDAANAFAVAHGIGQLAEGQQASVEFENSGSFEMLADVEAIADDFALASGIASGAIQQLALGTASGTAAASIDNTGSVLIGALANAEAGTSALALAGITSAISQSVIGGAGGSATLSNSGSITMAAEAEALAAGGGATDYASAQAFAFGIHALVTATGASGFAEVDMSNAGSIDISGNAHATGDGAARALGSAAYGLVGNATTWGSGPAEVNLTNDGTISIVGAADATGGHTANATGIALVGMDAFAAGGGEAIAALTNSGEVTIGADAHASAATNALAVSIAIDGLQASAHAGVGDAVASVDNSGELEMISNATASALNAQAFAIVGGTFFTGVMFESAAAMNGNASVLADNSGSISVVADALANGEVIASASAVGGPGINQFAFATSGDAFASVANSGSIEYVSRGEANAANSAFADALFYNAVAQFVNSNGGKGIVEMTNDGSISIGVVADADGGAWANAYAKATHEIAQAALVIGNDATLDLDNSGAIEVDVAALAEGSHASATATLATAMYQSAAALGQGAATVSIDNSGSIDLGVLASADSPDGAAEASAVLEGAAIQYAGAGSAEYIFGSTSGGLTEITQNLFPTGPASVLLDNSGSVDIAVAAAAEGGTSAIANATGYAVDQFARGSDASASIVNDGSMAIELGASAKADANAIADASLTGIMQSAAAAETTIRTVATEYGGQVTSSTSTPVGTALASFSNSGTFDLTGVATAEADSGSATAAMSVRGIDQSVTALDAQAQFANSGEFAVGARAEATGGTDAGADASASGYTVAGAGDIALDFRNEGEFAVIAQASADASTGEASAHAIGINAAGDGLLTGAIENEGDLVVRADAEAGDGTAFAEATGINVGSNANGLTVTNSGVLAVSAVTDGGSGQATGIGTFDTGSLGAAGITVTNNGGTIIARVSDDNGQTWQRGTAINLASASASSVVNLTGASRISGNIDLAAGQTVNVTGGESWFDGIINADCQFAACGEGTLNIGAGASLFFRHNAADGHSAAFIEQLNLASTGKLILELPASAGADSAAFEAEGPLIVTDVANLDGALLVRSSARLYEDSYLFDNLIDAETRNGQFDSCGIQGNPALLEISCAYDAQGNVDLGIERVAFSAVGGLTGNEAAVGSGIEAVYDVGLHGAFGEMVEQLFTFGADAYGDALYQLAGATHAAYLQSFNSLGAERNELIDRASGCELPGHDVSSLSCRTGKLHLWGQLDFTNRQNDGDAEVDGYDADRWTATIGGDVEVRPDVIAGASFAKLGNRLKFHDGERSDADGYELGAYAAIDPGNYYGKVIGTVSWFDGDSSRGIDWTDLGGSLAGQLKGDPDVRMWTLGAHFGYRVPIGETSLVTPFLNIDHSSATVDGFAESGVDGANLAIGDSTSSRTAVTLGARWAADIGGIVPQVELGYRHRFGDRRATLDAAFADEAGSDFDIVSAIEKRGSLRAGLSVGGKAGPVDLHLGYQGTFDGNATSHNANFRIVLPLGGK